MSQYASFDDVKLDPRSVAATTPPPEEGEFSKGLRGGAADLRANLHAFAGSAGRAAGFDGFAAGQEADSARAAQEAQAAQSQLANPTWGSVNSLRGGANWLAGQAGQLTPSLAGGLAAGVAGGLTAGPLGAIAAGTAAFTPVEAGGITRRMAEDPEASLRTPVENFGRSLGYGAMSAAAQNVVPGMMGGKLVGMGAQKAVGQTFKQSVAHNLGEGVIGQGVGGAGAEAIRQVGVNPDKPFDMEAIKEEGIANAVMGVPLAGAGIAGNALHSAPGKAKNMVQDGVQTARGGLDAAGEALSPAWDAVKAGAQGFQKVMPESVKDMADQWGTSAQSQITSAREALQGILEADNVPATIKAQAADAIKSVGNVSTRAWAFATEQARAGVDTAKQAVPDDLMARMRSMSAKPDDALDRMAAGRPLTDDAAMATATPEQAKSMLAQGTTKALDLASKTGSWLAERADLTPEQRQRVADLTTNLSDSASQAGIAAMAMAKKAKDATMSKLDALSTGLKEVAAKQEPNDKAKKSEDFEGFNKLITNKIGPMITQSHPELMSDPKAISKLGNTLRMYTQYAASDDAVRMSALHSMLSDALGADTASSVASSLHEFATKGDAEKTATYFKNITEAIKEDHANSKSKATLTDLVTKYSTDEGPGRSGIQATPDQWANLLRDFASGKLAEGKSKAQADFEATTLRNKLEQHFGTKAEQLLAAAEKEYNAKKPKMSFGHNNDDAGVSLSDEHKNSGVDYEDMGAAPNELSAATEYKGGGKNSRTLIKDPNLHRAEFGNESAAERVAKGEQAKGGASTRFVSVADNPAILDNIPSFKKFRTETKKAVDGEYDTYLAGAEGDSTKARERMAAEVQRRIDEKVAGYKRDGMGMVEVSKFDDADQLSSAELDKMRMDTDKHGSGDNPARLVVKDADGGTAHVFDAVAITRAMTKKINARGDWTVEDDRSPSHRMARAFSEGVAHLMEQFGRFKVSPETVIGHVGDKVLKAGDIKKLERDSGVNFKDDPDGGETHIRRTMSDKEASGAEREKNLATIEDEAKGKQDADREGNIHTAAARLDEKALEHRVNMDGSMVGTGAGRAPNVNPLLLKAEQLRRSNSAIGAKLGDRLGVLAKNVKMMSEVDQRKLLSVTDATKASDVAEVINPLAKKYADRIVAPGKKEPVAPVNKGSDATKTIATPDAVELRQKYLDNPPADYTSAKAAEIVAESRADLAKADAEYAKVKGKGNFDAEDALSDLRASLKRVIDKGESVLEGDASLAEKEGTPDPKVVAAKKAALLEKAASGDKGLIKELSTTSDAKGLQRAVDALAEAGPSEALDAANKRLGELISADPDIAYGLQTKKYSLESNNGDGREKLITRLADARRSEFVHANEAEVFVRSEGEVSYGPVQGGTKFFFSDGRSSHAYVIAPEHIAAVRYNLSVKPLERHADVLAYFAIQHASLDRHSGEFQSFTSLPSSPAGKWLESKNAVVPTGEFFSDGTTPINRVVGVTARQNFDFLADALAYAKHIEGADQIAVDWERITGANKGKRGSGMFDASKADNPDLLTDKGRKQVLDTIHTMLGDSVEVAFPMLAHAGEFASELHTDIIRVSQAALNPTSVAYHESLHAFFKQMSAHGSDDVNAVLEKAANTPHVMKQLRDLLAHSPEALAQLSNAEERAAYMFQFWGAGKLTLADAPKSLFTKLADGFKKILGIWTNDERALHVMDYFSSGEYAASMGDHAAVREALMDKGRNKALDSLHSMVKPFMELAENVVGAGSANLRDSGIPSLGQLADLVKKKATEAGADAGFLPAARLAKQKFLEQYASAIEGATTEHLYEAMEALQNGVKATSPEARAVQVGVRKTLDDMFTYLNKSGVNVADLGFNKDYFPRRWDAHYLSKNKEAFMDMARKYPDWHGAEETYNKLIANDGSELQVVDRPGMSSKQKRVLDFVSHADAAPFMSKDLHRTMDSYITQATRRGEWAARFGDDNAKLAELYDKARAEGATEKQIEQTKKFVAGVNGTLGDEINPTLRRAMGNMIVYQNIRLLPLAVFSMAVDPNGVLVRGGTVKDAWNTLKRGISEIPKGLRGDTSMDAQTRLAQDLGTIDNAVLHHALGSMYTQGVTGNTARKINDTFFKYNLVEQMNISMRVGATEAAMGFMSRHADGKHNAHSTRYLAELGLTPADIVMKDGRVAVCEGDGLTPEHAARMRSAVNQWVDGAVLRPDAADKPVWMNDPHFMLFSHLKQFVYSFQHTILQRVIHEARNGNYTPSAALLSYVPMMIAADMAKGMIQGGGEEPTWKKGWTVGDYVGNGVQRAGLLGVGQIGADAFKNVQEGGTGIGQLMGPTVEQLGDAVQTLGGHKQFGTMALHSLPANQLYAHAFGASRPDPTFAE